MVGRYTIENVFAISSKVGNLGKIAADFSSLRAGQLHTKTKSWLFRIGGASCIQRRRWL